MLFTFTAEKNEVRTALVLVQTVPMFKHSEKPLRRIAVEEPPPE
jgi:hypothetical protein